MNNSTNNTGRSFSRNQGNNNASNNKKQTSSANRNNYKTVNNFNPQNKNAYAQNQNQNKNAIASKIDEIKMRAKKEAARHAIRTGLNAVVPGTGEIADKALKTEKGNELLDEYAKAPTNTEGLINVGKKIKEETKKKTMMLTIVGIMGPLLLLVLIFLLIFKNADTQIYSNQNDGKVDENYEDYGDASVFAKYPGLYEKVEKSVQKISSKYKLEVDKYLILATLIAPIENGNIMPVDDGSCSSDKCYYLDGKSYTWEEFVELWGDQAEYLAKAQIMTYVNKASKVKPSCGDEDTMEQYAMNDLEVNEFNFWALFNPVNWFKGFRNVAEAELNAKCIYDVPLGKSTIPTIYVISKEQGIYYSSINENMERTYVKDPNTGGVYFWNLVNKGGFIHVYMKDYLNIDKNINDDQNYEQNLSKILEIGNYIYSYYESIRKDCYNYQVVESTIENIKVKHKTDDGYDEIPFEDQYIGGVMLAEYNSGNHESLKAFAILARSYGISVVGVDGEGIIENSSNNQNYNPNYTPEKYPHIAKAVEETRGMVVTNYASEKVRATEYDAFCPVTNKLENGFYYLPDGQNKLPVNPDAYEEKTGKEFKIPEKYLTCPCYQNKDSRPEYPDASVDPSCWKDDLTYKASGGHGRGASQYGLKYFGAFEYGWESLIKMFYGQGATVRRLSSSLEIGQCQNVSSIQSVTAEACGLSFEVTDSNHTEIINGKAFEEPIEDVLTKNGYSVDCLNQCVETRVIAAGPGTRAGVVEAAYGLIDCLYQMTGGYTLPYDHTGGKVEGNYANFNTDIAGKLGVNTRWGKLGGTCDNEPCRYGLNCANFVRWSFCNGGMDLCSKGSAGAYSMTSNRYYPEKTYVEFSGRNVTGDDPRIGTMSTDELIRLGEPGDTMNTDSIATGDADHAMVIIGKDDTGYYIAENGRKTRKIAFSSFTDGRTRYRINFLDDYYANSENINNLY